jgi:hypothetical protein
VVDVNGRIIEEKRIDNRKTKVVLSEHSKGTYFVLLKLKGRPVYSGKLLIE